MKRMSLLTIGEKRDGNGEFAVTQSSLVLSVSLSFLSRSRSLSLSGEIFCWTDSHGSWTWKDQAVGLKWRLPCGIKFKWFTISRVSKMPWQKWTPSVTRSNVTKLKTAWPVSLLLSFVSLLMSLHVDKMQPVKKVINQLSPLCFRLFQLRLFNFHEIDQSASYFSVDECKRCHFE